MTTHRSTCTLITGAATAGVLLLALVALLWAGGDPQQHGATGARLGLFRRPATAQDLEEGGLNKQQQSPHGPREAKASLRRRPGQALGATDVLWGLEPGCLAALYGAQHEGDCGCSTVTSTNATGEGLAPRLTFVDSDATTLWPAGGTVRATLRARHKCSDVVNAAFHSPGAFNVLGRDVTVPARVLGQDTGDYAVSATLRHAGTYTLKAWLLWEGFAPRPECRESPCRRCHEDWAPRYTYGAAARTINVVVAAEHGDGAAAAAAQEEEPPPPPQLPTCASLDAALDGAWVQDPALLIHYYDRVREEAEAAAVALLNPSPTPPFPPPAPNTTITPTDPGLYTRLTGAWVPSTCRLPLHSAATLRRALQGKHLHFVGDSTTREFMHGVQRLLWPERPALAHDQAWVPNDYDSGWADGTRFSFNWAGGAATTDSMQGLAALVQRPQRFLHALPPDADLVLLSAGTHDVAGKRSIPGYTAALSTVFDWVAARVASVRRDPRRAVWRPALPLLSQFYKPGVGLVNGTCRQEHSAALQWMRLLGVKEARGRGFAVLDAYRVVEAEDAGRAWGEGGRLPCSHDGMHYAGCDSYTVLLAVFVHHVVGVLGGEASGAASQGGGGRALVEEVECGLASCS